MIGGFAGLGAVIAGSTGVAARTDNGAVDVAGAGGAAFESGVGTALDGAAAGGRCNAVVSGDAAGAAVGAMDEIATDVELPVRVVSCAG
jgi:hypothetical protein